MSQFKIVLIAGGFGGLGGFILDEFVSNGNYTVKLLTRPSSLAERAAEVEKYKALGVEIIASEYNDHAGLVKVLNGVDVVVSTVGSAALYDSQLALIKASEEAGVKRFVPSEFGTDHSKIKSALFTPKIKIADYLRSSKLEYTFFYTGFFTDQALPFLDFDLDNGKAVIIGSGEERITLTHRKDVAKYVVASLNDPKSRNAVYGTRSSSHTLHEIVALAEKHSGKKFEVTYRDLTTVEAELTTTKENTFEFAKNTIGALLAQGHGLVDESFIVNHEEVKTISVEQYLQEYYNKA